MTEPQHHDPAVSQHAGVVLAPSNLIYTPASLVLSADRAYQVRASVASDKTVDHISFVVRSGTGNASHPVDVGIWGYDGSGDPIAIQNSGPVTGKIDTAGWKNVALGADVELSPNVNYLFTIASPNTPTLLGGAFTAEDAGLLFPVPPAKGWDVAQGIVVPYLAWDTSYPLPSDVFGFGTDVYPTIVPLLGAYDAS